LLYLNRKLRDHGLGRPENVLRLIDVATGDHPANKSRVRDVERLELALDVFVRNLELRLDGADLNVNTGYVRGQCHEHIVIVGDRGQECCIRRLDGPAKFAPQIELPSSLRAKAVAGIGALRQSICPRGRDSIITQ
jgi:hypothetical protein